VTNNKDNTKEQLLLAALRLFADQGLDAVSMRNINQSAGAKNASAAHYHFGSKMGVVTAIFDYVASQLAPAQEVAINRLIELEQAGELSVREVLRSAYMPQLSLYTNPRIGRDGIKFWARLRFDQKLEILELENEYSREFVSLIDGYLQRVLPELSVKLLRTRLLFCFVNLLHGLANLELMAITPFGDLRADSPEKLVEHFLDYTSAGISAPVNLED